MVLSTAIREARQARSLTQREAASLVGVSQPYLCLLERGERIPALRVYLRLRDVLGVDPVAEPQEPVPRSTDIQVAA